MILNNDFKHLLQDFAGKLLLSVKQKGEFPYKYASTFKKFPDDKLPDRCEFFLFFQR